MSNFTTYGDHIFFFKMGRIPQPLHQNDAYGFYFIRNGRIKSTTKYNSLLQVSNEGKKENENTASTHHKVILLSSC
jgi:hypothetical protein